MKKCFVYIALAGGLMGTHAKADDVPVVKFAIKSDKPVYTPCRSLKFTVEGGGKNLLWECDADLNDVEIDGKTFRCIPKSGNLPVKIRCYTALADQVVVKAELVLLPDVPVVPPDPVTPPKPLPSDVLTPDVLKITDENSRKDLKALAALYTLMSLEALKPEYDSVLALNTRYKDSANLMLGDKLLNVRTLLSAEIIKAAGDVAETQLTDESRKAMVKVFARLSFICIEASK